MSILELLKTKLKSECETGRSSAIKELKEVFSDSCWGVEPNFNFYTEENAKNLWKNELRKPVRRKLEDEGWDKDKYKEWLGEIHFTTINPYWKSLFDGYRSNVGWRAVIMSIPRAETIVLGIASHYQNAQNNNRLGEVSNLLFDIAKDGLENSGLSMFGRKISSLDWDQNGLILNPITSLNESSISDVSPEGINLKDIRTTTLKKTLASFICVRVVPTSISKEDFFEELSKLAECSQHLAENVFPFSNLEDFEAFRALAYQDLASASARIQLRKKSSTRSVVRVYYGPPGTGKTLSAVREAVKLVEPSFHDKGDFTASFGRFNEHRDQCAFVTFHPSLQYEDLIESIRPVVGAVESNDVAEETNSTDVGEESDTSENKKSPTNGNLSYRIHEGVLLRMIRRALQNPNKEFVVVIDEINRGDLSRILGPLISAMETDKRVGAEFPIGFELQYPHASELESRLFMPSNLHLIGTMNSSDRNIALVDHALRRRFDFVEVPPEPKILNATNDTPSIDCGKLLTCINERIEHLIDADHCIGHGYLVGCKTNLQIIERLVKKIIPLLREYFYGNEGLMLLVLGVNPEQKQKIFVLPTQEDNFAKLFSVDMDVAATMGYRAHTTPRNLRIDSRFWNGAKLIPGPDDEQYAVACIRQIFETNMAEESQPSSTLASTSNETVNSM
jgi:5-methylcytosine-specific restriction protein B